MQSRSLFADNHKSTLVVDNAINAIVQSGTNVLYEKYLVTRMPAHLAHVQRKEVENTINQHALPSDTGETFDALLIYWCEEEEPV